MSELTVVENIANIARAKLLTYGTEVVEQRAVPDYRDGLKPVHRFLLWASYGLKLHHTSSFKKAARTVGETLGKYSPHGDTSTYDAMVKMAGTKDDDGKKWITRNSPVPLIEGYGNWGDNVDGAAAYRYTEGRLSKFSDMYLLDPVYLAVSDYHDNFSGDEKVPYVLPAKVPVLLFNGSVSIAFGVSAECPPMHPTGVLKLVRECLSGATITYKNCLKDLKFNPTYGGQCISGTEELTAFYKTGKGSVSFLPMFEIDPAKKILALVSACPELTSKTSFDGLMAKLVALPEVKSVADVTDKISFRLEVIPNRGLTAEQFEGLVENVKRLCERRASFDMGVTVRTPDGAKFERTNIPKLIKDWCAWRVQLEVRVIKYLLVEEEKKLARQNLLLLAANSLDVIFKALKVDDSSAYLVKYLKITAEQAHDILEFRVRQLKTLEIVSINKAIKEIEGRIRKLNADLKKPATRVIADIDAFALSDHTL